MKNYKYDNSITRSVLTMLVYPHWFSSQTFCKVMSETQIMPVVLYYKTLLRLSIKRFSQLLTSLHLWSVKLGIFFIKETSCQEIQMFWPGSS